jgi:geranylgeranyl reductase family protein
MNANSLDLKFDAQVLIVGAGPAGAAAAYYLAKNGINTLVLERQVFPRDKVCGDFVGPAAVAELEAMGVTAQPEFQSCNVIKKAAVYLDGEELIVSDFPSLGGFEGRVIPRKQLDGWIVAAAKAAGAKIWESTLVTAVEFKAEAVEAQIKTPSGTQTLRAPLLIAADGTNSIIAHKLHGEAPPKANRNVGVRGYFTGVLGETDQADMHFSSDSFPGYCWLFPTSKDQANVGVGVLLETFPKCSQPRELFFQLINQDAALKARLKNAQFTGKLEAYPINTYNPQRALTADRVMLIGEAAGLVNPINGEGIQYALLSGKWAAQTATNAIQSGNFSKAAFEAYASRIQTELAAGFETSAFIVQLIRNRNLNPLWLGTFQAMTTHAKTDPKYAQLTGSILAGLISPNKALTPQFIATTLQETTINNGIRIIGNTITNPTNAPTIAIKIAQTTLETAINTIQNPLEFLQWSIETTTKMAQLAITVPPQMLKENKPNAVGSA